MGRRKSQEGDHFHPLYWGTKRNKISQDIVLRLTFWKSAFTLIWPFGYNALPSDVSCSFVLGHLVTHLFQFFLKRASESENARVLRRCQTICVFATLPEFPINRNRWHDLSEARLIPCSNKFWLMGPTLPRHVMLKPLKCFGTRDGVAAESFKRPGPCAVKNLRFHFYQEGENLGRHSRNNFLSNHFSLN